MSKFGCWQSSESPGSVDSGLETCCHFACHGGSSCHESLSRSVPFEVFRPRDSEPAWQHWGAVFLGAPPRIGGYHTAAMARASRHSEPHEPRKTQSDLSRRSRGRSGRCAVVATFAGFPSSFLGPLGALRPARCRRGPRTSFGSSLPLSRTTSEHQTRGREAAAKTGAARAVMQRNASVNASSVRPYNI